MYHGIMALPNTVPIGNSIVHVLENSGSNSARTNTPPIIDDSSREHQPLPCLLLPRDSRRILLQGPERSGRTSMVMNLAYTCASRRSSSCHCMAQPCRCTTVVLYRKTPHSSLEEDFPLPCHDTGVTAKRKRGLAGEHSIHDWKLDVLRRIRIEYVSSPREILQDMLGLLGKPWQDQPLQAILIDDLDQICHNDHDGDDAGRGRIGGGDNPSIIHIMQTRTCWMDVLLNALCLPGY